MPFTIGTINNHLTVFAICDQCGEPIRTAPTPPGRYSPHIHIFKNGVGNVEWARDLMTGELVGGPYLSHKRCTEALEARYRSANTSWATMELDDYLVRLFANIGLDLDEFVDKLKVAQRVIGDAEEDS